MKIVSNSPSGWITPDVIFHFEDTPSSSLISSSSSNAISLNYMCSISPFLSTSRIINMVNQLNMYLVIEISIHTTTTRTVRARRIFSVLTFNHLSDIVPVLLWSARSACGLVWKRVPLRRFMAIDQSLCSLYVLRRVPPPLLGLTRSRCIRFRWWRF